MNLAIERTIHIDLRHIVKVETEAAQPIAR